MREVKDFHSEILHIIKDMRSRGFSDNRIIQTFQLVLEDTQGMYAIPKKDTKPNTTIHLKVFEDVDELDIKGDPEGLLHGMAAMMLAYRYRTKSTDGESLADLILELEQCKESGVEKLGKEVTICRENTRY